MLVYLLVHSIVEVEIDIKREIKAIEYLVPDEVGALSKSLQVFSVSYIIMYSYSASQSTQAC